MTIQSFLNKSMTALHVDYWLNQALACDEGIAAKPRGYVRVFVDGNAIVSAENDYEGRVYWTLDDEPPFAPLAYADIVPGARLVWCTNNLSVQAPLWGGESIQFDYEVEPTPNALTTTADFDLATNDAVTTPPRRVTLNGIVVGLGNGDKTRACYFSGDSGATARAIANIAVDDQLYWVGSVAGYQLSADTDVIEFVP